MDNRVLNHLLIFFNYTFQVYHSTFTLFVTIVTSFKKYIDYSWNMQKTK